MGGEDWEPPHPYLPPLMPLLPRLGAAAALIGLTPLLGSTGCDGPGLYACTEIGCSSGYTVSLVAADRFPDGAYDIALTTDGATEACQFEVADGRLLSDETCNAGYLIRATVLTLEAVGITYPMLTSEIEIVVSRDGSEIERLTTTPVYETVQPNGPDCAPTCRSAVTTIAIDSAP